MEEALDPILSALAIRDEHRLVAPPFLHFGYGRGISWLPLVIGSPDGLLEVAMRRSVVQALVAPLVFLAGRRFLGSAPGAVLAPGLLALVVATSEDLLQTAISGHETYMAAEWGALALLAAGSLGRAPRRASCFLGVCLAMAVMNHPLAIPTLLLLLLAPAGLPRRIACGSSALLLLPQAVRFAASLTGGLPQEFAPLPASDSHGRLGELLSVLRPAVNLEVLLLFLALPLSVWLLRGSARRPLAWIGCGALGLALLEVALSGSSNGWYWRPMAPLMALLGSLSLAELLGRGPGLRQLVGVLAVGIGCGLALASVGRTAAAFEDRHPSLRYAGHVSGLGAWLEAQRGAEPWPLRAIADTQGVGRHQLAALAVDRRVAGSPPDLFEPLGEEGSTGPVLLHVEAAPAELSGFARLLGEEGELLAQRESFVLVRLAAAEVAVRLESELCALGGGTLRFDDPRRWTAILGQPARPREDPTCAAP